MTAEKAIAILKWWASHTGTMVIKGHSGHVFDVVYGPMNQHVYERWLGSNIFSAAGAVLVMAYETHEPVSLKIHEVLAEAPGARERFGLQ